MLQAERTPGPSLNVVILGDRGVGKTSLLNRRVHNSFNTSPQSRGAGFVSQHVTVHGRSMPMRIWDAPDQDCTDVYRDAHACMIVYDVTNIESFHSVETWTNQFIALKNSRDPTDIPIVVVGNKTDKPLQEVQVPRKLAAAWCRRFHVALPLVETSAKTGDRVAQAFRRTTRQLPRNWLDSNDVVYDRDICTALRIFNDICRI
jgi:Ras-related protein Rab-7A